MWEALNPKFEKVFVAEEAIQTIADAQEEKWICPNCKAEMSLIKEYIQVRESCDEIIIVTSHFAHYPETTCKDVRESDSHYNRKMYILSQLFSKRIPITTGGVILFVPKEEVAGVEKNIGNNRADILINFKKQDGIFGNGICIEIMQTENTESIEQKIINWTKKGYSFTFFYPNEFDGYLLKSKLIVVKYPYLKAIEKTYQLINENIRENLFKLENLNSLLKLEIKYKKKFICATCGHSSIDKDINNKESSGLICCWIERNIKKNKSLPKKYLPEHCCSDYIPNYKKLKNGVEGENELV